MILVLTRGVKNPENISIFEWPLMDMMSTARLFPKHYPVNVGQKFCIPGPSFLPSLVMHEQENYVDVSQTSFKGFNFKCRGQVVHMQLL